ncbi:Heat shock factor-binding protein 1 [Perkinsus olseni]|uniref:Heat shock factor-binding protein 1 n=1 Tax=Perkinsus olseni TaxID=32597 RepID=A0A7J6R4T0_PEROL|nr:Heat shock factor-binding protein 1 [Perkinsus olseni]
MAEVGKSSSAPYSAEQGGAERPSKTSQEASVTAEQSNQELTAFVSNLLKEMVRLSASLRCHHHHHQQTRFQSMSDTIVGRIDDMTNRVDELERNIQELANKVAMLSLLS